VRTGASRYNAVLATEGIAPVAVRDWFDLSHSFATRNFQNGVPGLDYPRGDLPANVTFVGALPAHKTGTQGGFEDWERVRTHPKAVVAVSQRTMDNHDPEKLIVPTLEAIKDGPYLVVATTGGQNTQQLRRRYPQENIIIEDYVDFDVLFAHTDVLVCNGGYGSVMSALSHGAPVLAAGLREGKNDINARLAYRHLGIDLKTERPTSAQVGRGVDDLLANDTVRHNVAGIRAELHSYQPFDIIDRQLAADFAGDPAVGAA
jgi:UDP:flavonoid glycosyltransferase YjiC (YdhE family)